MTEADLITELANIPDLTLAELRQRWTMLIPKPLPRVRRTLLSLALAWELQAQVHGGLPLPVQRKLAQIADGRTRTTTARAGTKLVREWKGVLHTVKVEADDRLLFSTPVRRLSDKTQVWPMDDNDGVRTRLTHSHEVANLARSIGTRIHSANADFFSGAHLHQVIQPMLSAIGLAHDLGNPPFGHQGEAAISRWFEQRKEWIFTNHDKGGRCRADRPPMSCCRHCTWRYGGASRRSGC